MTTAGLALLVFMQAAPFPMVAQGDEAPGGRMHVGDTGIRCARQPCLNRGLFIPDAQGLATRSGLLMTDPDGRTPPPPMVASDLDRTAVVQAWEEGGCLALEGRLIPGMADRPVLRVDRVLGACRDH